MRAKAAWHAAAGSHVEGAAGGWRAEPEGGAAHFSDSASLDEHCRKKAVRGDDSPEERTKKIKKRRMLN